MTLGGRAELSERAVQDLAQRLSGRLLRSGDEGYDEARLIWNRAVDRRPTLIARCAGADDVRAAVDYAREHDLLVSVRGGGHNVTGHAVCEGGLVTYGALQTMFAATNPPGTWYYKTGYLDGEASAALASSTRCSSTATSSPRRRSRGSSSSTWAAPWDACPPTRPRSSIARRPST